MPPRELTDDEVFGGRELSDEEVFAKPSEKQKRKSFGLGFMEGATNVFDKIPASPLDYIPGLDARPAAQANRQQLQNYFAKREETEEPSIIGKAVGGMTATLPVALVTRNPWIAGAATGGLTSDEKTPMGIAGDMAKGAVIQKAGGMVIDKVADTLSPIVSPAVKRLTDAGVKLTPGMRRGGRAMAAEDKAMSRPIVGPAIAKARGETGDSFVTSTVNEALTPLGVRVPAPVKPGHDAVDWAHTEVSRAYDAVIPNVAVKVNGQQFAQKIAPVAQTLPAAQRKELQRLISLHLKNGQLAGQELKTAQGEIRRLSSLYGRSQAAADNELGRALGAVDDELTAAMLAQNPKWAPELQKVNEAYRGLKVVEDAASRADGGVFNTGQLKQAVRRGDRTKGKSGTARGNAFMQDFSEAAREVLPAQVPNSGTADRMMAGNIFSNLRGAADLAGFKGSVLLDQFGPQVPGQIPARLAGGLRRLRQPAAASAIAGSTNSRN